MPIKFPNNDLPKASPNAPLRGDTLVRDIAKQWWEDYQASDEFSRDRAMPELPLRASDISTRCDRALFYKLSNTPESDPNDAADVFRMMLGQLIHDKVAEAVAKLPTFGKLDADGRKHGWWVEEIVDLRPAGFPGSAHGDIVWYEHGVITSVGEIKSQGGFAFKMMTTNFKGAPEGPRWDHVMQSAMVAVALGAPKIIVMYFAMESISPSLAKGVHADEFGRFTAQWEFDTADWTEAVRIEAARQRRILAMATAEPPIRPERSLSVDDVPDGAVVTNVDNGAWVIVDLATGRPRVTGKTWHCDYCNFREQCRADGAASSIDAA